MAADLRLIIGRLAVLNSIKEYTLAPVFTYHLSACFPPLDKGGSRGVHSGEISDETILVAGLQARKSPFSVLFQMGKRLGNLPRQN